MVHIKLQRYIVFSYFGSYKHGKNDMGLNAKWKNREYTDIEITLIIIVTNFNAPSLRKEEAPPFSSVEGCCNGAKIERKKVFVLCFILVQQILNVYVSNLA